MNNMILIIDGQAKDILAADIMELHPQYSLHYFQKQFAYLVEKKEKNKRNFVIFMDHLNHELQKRILFSFMKAEDIKNCVAITPVVSLKNSIGVGDLLLFEDLVHMDEITTDNGMDRSQEKQPVNKPMFCSYLRRRLIGLMNQENHQLIDEGTVISFKKLRNETSAEGLLYGNWNIDGMTMDIFSLAGFAKEHLIHMAPIGIIKRKSVNLEAHSGINDEKENMYITNFRKAVHLLLRNISLFNDIPVLCNKLEFREYLL